MATSRVQLYMLCVVFAIFSFFVNAIARHSPQHVVNVDHYAHGGGGGDFDYTDAFERAWSEVCDAKDAVLIVPKGKTFHLRQISFKGPCNSNTTIEIEGVIKAPKNMSDYSNGHRHWITFDNVERLTLKGGGTVDGNGKIWWENSCMLKKLHHCIHMAPTAMTFKQCNNLIIEDITLKNAQRMHIVIDDCTDVRATNLSISAPSDSPNTDGVHVTASSNVEIQSSHIGTGDDCISIVSGSSNIQATDISCGPGHGISIGSLGKDKEEAHVSDVIVRGARLSGTTNGLRIKTWPGGSGHVRSVIYDNVTMHNVENPIIINQHYCEHNPVCKEEASAVQVQRVTYNNIRGTSSSETAIKLDCSSNFPCKGITLQDVRLKHVGGDETKAECSNVAIYRLGPVFPSC